MSKNIYLGANVELSSDTFASWADKTNQIIDDMGKVVVTVAPVAQANSTNGAMTVGNAHIQGVLSALQMSAVELRGGTMSVPAPLVIGTDLVFANTNVIDIGTNSSRLKNLYTVNAIANLVAANVANIVVLNANTGDVKTLTSNVVTVSETLTSNNNFMRVAQVTTSLSANALIANTSSIVTQTSNTITTNAHNANTIVANTATIIAVSANSVVANTATIIAVGANTLTANAATIVSVGANTVTANSATIVSVSSNTITANTGNILAVTANTATITTATIATSNTNNAKANTIVANTATIDSVNSNTVTANTGNILSVTANNISANNVTANTANVGSVMAVSIDTGSLVSNTLTAGATTLASINVAGDTWVSGNLVVAGVTSLAGNSAFSVNTSISEYLTVQKQATVNGNTVIGVDAAQTLNINALTFVSANVEPTSNNNINVGTSLKRMGDVYANRVMVSNVVATALSGNGAALTSLNASNISSGTIADARLPGTMAGKAFSSSIQINPASGNANIYLRENSINRGVIFTDIASDRLFFRKYSTTGAAEGEISINGAASTDFKYNGATVWTANNDGASSGLDADLLDGQEGSYYLNVGNATGTLADARLPGTMTGKKFTTFTEIAGPTYATGGDYARIAPSDFGTGKAGLYFSSPANTAQWNIGLWDGTTANGTLNFSAAALTHNGDTIWTANNDGVGSGLDADMLDGYQASALPVSTPVQTALNLKANLASPAFTGTPTAPTQTQGNNSTRLATTAYVDTGLATKQASLGFTPVQQGGGANQLTNKIYIGWMTGSRLGLQIDTTDYGNVFPININGDATTVGGYTPAQLPISTPTQTALNTMQTAINGKANTSSLGNSASKNFYYGTAVPASSFGAEGDIYFRYE